MDISVNISNASVEDLDILVTKLNFIGINMATLSDIKTEIAGITDAIASQNASFDLLVKEVRQLLALGDVAGADALLAEIAADKEAILASVVQNTELAAQVDAINGDPIA